MSHTTSDHEHWRYTVGTYVSPFYWPDEYSATWHGFDHYRRNPTDADVVTVHRPDGSTYDLSRADWQPAPPAASGEIVLVPGAPAPKPAPSPDPPPDFDDHG